MRLDELRKQLELQSLQQYLQYMQTKNKLKIHNGKFSIVLEPPTGDFVYKVWSLDSAWDRWIGVCRQNQHKSYIPKVGKKIYKFDNIFVRRSDSSSSINVVKIEKLQPLSPDIQTDDMIEKFWKPFVAAMRANEDCSDILDIIRIEQPRLVQFIEKVLPILENNLPGSATLDLHLGNIMMRGDEYVITDPYAQYSELESLYRLPNQMDTSSFLNNTISYSTADYISGKNKATVPSKDITKQNPIIWLSDDSIFRFGLTETDFPDDIFNDRKIVTSMIDHQLQQDKPFPVTFIKAISKNIDYLAYYIKRTFDIPSWLFLYCLENVDLCSTEDGLQAMRILVGTAAYNHNTQFIAKVVDMILSKIDSEEDGIARFCAIIPTVLFRIENKPELRDMVINKLEAKIDMSNPTWVRIHAQIDWISVRNKTLRQLFKKTELLENTIPEVVIINGKPKPTTNSNGALISDTIRGIKNFYHWFGNSIVVDMHGRPLVMYHGTKAKVPPKEMIPSYKRKLPKNKIVTYTDPIFGDTVKQHSMASGVGYNKDQAGMFFTDSEYYATNYGKVNKYYLKIENPMMANGDYIPFFGKGDIDILQDMGKDGYIDNRKAGEFVIFSGNQAKRIENPGTFSTKSLLLMK